MIRFNSIDDAFPSAVKFLLKFLPTAARRWIRRVPGVRLHPKNTRNENHERRAKQRLIDLAQGTLRSRNGWLRSVSSGYAAKAKLVEEGKGHHKFVARQTGHVQQIT